MIKIETAKGEIKEMTLKGTTSELCADMAILVYSFYSDLKKQNQKMAKKISRVNGTCDQYGNGDG